MPNVTTHTHAHKHMRTIYFNQVIILRIRPVIWGNNIRQLKSLWEAKKKIDAKEYIDMQFDSLTI